MICVAKRNTKGIFSWNDFGEDGKWKWKIGEKIDGMSVWLEGEWGRKMVGPAIFSPAPPN